MEGLPAIGHSLGSADEREHRRPFVACWQLVGRAALSGIVSIRAGQGAGSAFKRGARGDDHVVLRALVARFPHVEAGLFTPCLNLCRRQADLARRAVLARARRVEFGDDDQRTRRQQPMQAAQDGSGIVRVMQHHRDQCAIRVKIAAVQRGGVRDQPADLRDSAFFLQALDVGECVGGAIDRIDDALRSHPVGEKEAHKAGPAADIQNTVAGFEIECVHPRRHQLRPQRLSRIDLVPGGMAQVFPERLLHEPAPQEITMRDRSSRDCQRGEGRSHVHDAHQSERSTPATGRAQCSAHSDGPPAESRAGASQSAPETEPPAVCCRGRSCYARPCFRPERSSCRVQAKAGRA